MDSEKIVQDLNRRFERPLPEFYKRRIVLWIDEEGEFRDLADGLSLDKAKVVRLNGRNNFAVKKLLAVDDTESNFLVYRPFPIPSDEENWLLDIELYSGEPFRADQVSIWMDELRIEQTLELRDCVKKYKDFFKSKERRFQLSRLAPCNSSQLLKSIMAVLAGQKDAKLFAILKAVLKAGLQNEDNPVYQEFVKFKIDGVFWQMVQQGTGYQEETPDLLRLAEHILLTAAARTMRADMLSDFQEFVKPSYAARCYDFISEWTESKDDRDILEIVKKVEEQLNLADHFSKCDTDDLLTTGLFPSINEVILLKLMKDISNHIIDVGAITRIVEKRRPLVWYEDFKNYFEGIFLLAKAWDFYQKHADGFHTMDPVKLWNEYTSDYCRMDGWYRDFYRHYSEIVNNFHETLNDPYLCVKDEIERLYVNWFLAKLGETWTNVFEDDLSRTGWITGIPRQTGFYEDWVKNAGNKNRKERKVYVIISDAMRYAVALTLAEQLRRETHAEVELKSIQGIFPAITKFGMAALLPHKELSVELSGDKSSLNVLADGVSADAPNREKILKKADPDSVVLKYEEFVGQKKEQRRAAVRNNNVVYIYHDTIDAAGHKDEKKVFNACDEAIRELKNLVRIITNELSGVNILITSDHGFLYTAEPLKEADKVDKGLDREDIVEMGRRYVLAQKGTSPEFLVPVRFMDGKTQYEAFAPRESIRIKMPGAGQNFVHGGISPQEMVVPVIEYRTVRSQSKEYLENKIKYDTKPVEVSMISMSEAKISNMTFSLGFYQREPVGGNRIAAEYLVYFTDDVGNKVSDVQTIIADRTNGDVQERKFRCRFHLKAQGYSSTEVYYLVIAKKDGGVLRKQEFQIDIPLSMDGFNFLDED